MGETNEKKSADVGKKDDQERTRINKKLFLDYFPQFRGVILHTAKKVGISDDVVYEWRREDPEFAAAMEKVTVDTKFKIRDVLLHKILIEKDGPSTRYWLDRKDPEFKPTTKTEVITGNKTLEDILKDDEDNLNDGNNNNDTTPKPTTPENKEGSKIPDGETVSDTGQTGKDNPLPLQQSPTVLLEEKNETEPHSEVKTKGNIQSHRRGPASRVYSERY